jgi:uncharacterized iron-regulated protein
MLSKNTHRLLGLCAAALAAGAALAEPASPPDPAGADWNPVVLPLAEVPRLHQVLADVDDRRVVFVGETHTRYDHHLVQLEVLKFLHRRHGDVAVGVEWFQYPFQAHIDDYLAGRITEAEMLERTGYFERWRFDYRLYRPIVEYAKANGLPLLALNAPAELTRRIGDVGMAALSDALRAQLPREYDRSDVAYEARLRVFFEQHPAGSRRFENFLDVMLTWDETMAEQAAKYLGEHPGRRMVIMAGSGHVAYRSGIPNRLERRIGEPGSVLLVDWEPLEDTAAADYIVLSEPRELPPQGLLGAFLEGNEDGVRIVELSEQSAIGGAGIAKDDILLSIDGRAVDSFAAVKLALLDRTPGEVIKVRYRHKGWLGGSREREADVTLGGRAERGHP